VVDVEVSEGEAFTSRLEIMAASAEEVSAGGGFASEARKVLTSGIQALGMESGHEGWLTFSL
jgi:hypothetical protein